MKKFILLQILYFFIVFNTAAQQKTKIGLTLSGGGAKGLAHIGILQAIDSAGLKIDYITGTSMGSIMGAMYAVGYSGNQIEEIARTLDWGRLFSGKPVMSNVNITEKEEFQNYALELPFEEGKLKIGTGLIEGQEIWVKFQELFMPVYNIKNFNDFSIPFRCITTDLATGNAVVMDKGEVVTAIRASMAIPSVFTTIDYENTKLVDGGLIRNFPVRDAIAMGANYTIGVNISQSLLKAEELTSAIDVLYQIGFYRDAEDFKQEVQMCNILIEPPMTGYSAASFGSAEELIAIGQEWGRKFYPQFKHLADSLKKADPGYNFNKNRLPDVKKIVVDEITVSGLENTSKKSFMNNLNVNPGDSCDGLIVAEGVRQIFGSKNYSRINYAWEATTPGHAKLNFFVIENPLTTFKLALHYNTFSKIALIAGVESKNLLFDRSKTTLKLNISENYRFYLEQNQAFGKRDNNNVLLSAYYESFKYPIYEDFKQKYLYRNNFTQFDLKVQHVFNRSSALGIGTSYESIKLTPKVFGEVSVEAGNSYFNSYLYYEINTLDEKMFPTKGLKLNAKAGYIYNQNPDELFIKASELTANIDTLNFEGYSKLELNVEHYSKLNSKFSLMKQFNGGINLNEDQSYLNFYYIGGLIDFLRNQITFAGLSEYEVYTNSVATSLIGLRYNPIKNVFATARANVALYDFMEKDPDEWNSDNFLSGYSATLAYASGFGPIQFSLIYSDQSKRLAGYMNVGFHF